MSEPVVVQAADGARVIVQRLGAQLQSWIPAGGAEQLFVARHAPIGTKAFKGGMPVCFPQFADLGPLPQHGFARDLVWTPAGDAFVLSDAGPLATQWPHSFALRLRVEAKAGSLRVSLAVENTGAGAWDFTAALHTYLKVADIASVTLEGLGGLRYHDKVRGADAVQDQAPLRVSAETDRVYFGAAAPVQVRDGERTLEVAGSGFRDVVVWNPWQGCQKRWPQFGPEDYRRMICVEAAVVGSPVTMEPGERWSGEQTLTLL